jgi:hypothetical protein
MSENSETRLGTRRIGTEIRADGRPEPVYPEHDDPAFSARPPQPPPAALAGKVNPPRDTQYAGHPEFSQDAAHDEPVVFTREEKQGVPIRSGKK